MSIRKNVLVSFDFDCSLFDHESEKITPSAIETIERLRKKYYIVLASGRDMDLPHNKRFIEQIKPDAIIHANGAKITKAGRILREFYYPQELIKRIIEEAEKEQWCIGAHIGNNGYFVNRKEAVAMYYRWWGRCDLQFCPAEELITKKIYTMLTGEPKENIRIIENRFPELHAIWFGSMDGADIVRKEVSKKQGMQILLDDWGITFGEVIAFGDSYNDIELLSSAKVGVAMGNSDDRTKKEADFVTDDIGKDGIWNACKKLGIV